MMMGQDLDVKSMVNVMKASDLYIDVIENVQCVLDNNVISLLFPHF
jgi:hypothetical protein